MATLAQAPPSRHAAQVCEVCGELGTRAATVQKVDGVPTHKRCRRCRRPGCERPYYAKGLCQPDYMIGYNREQYAADPEAGRARARAWYHANPEKAAAKYARQKASGMHRAYANRYYWQRRMLMLSRAHNLRAARLGLPGRVTEAQLQGRWDLYGGRCYLCRAAADGFDHVKPLAQGGPHIAANMRPCCTPCNSTKGAEWDKG